MTESQEQAAVTDFRKRSKPDAYTAWYAVWTSVFAPLVYVLTIFHLYFLLIVLALPALISAAVLIVSLVVNIRGRRWRRTLSIIAAPGIAGLFFVLLAWLGPWLGIEPLSHWHVVSSSISPGNKLVAENSVGGEDEDPIGRVSVREPTGRIAYETVFKQPIQPLFFRWTDSGHLLVLYDSQQSLPAKIQTRSDGSVGVTYSTYVRYEAADASKVAKRHSTLFLNLADVSATFKEEARRAGLHS